MGRDNPLILTYEPFPLPFLNLFNGGNIASGEFMLLLLPPTPNPKNKNLPRRFSEIYHHFCFLTVVSKRIKENTPVATMLFPQIFCTAFYTVFIYFFTEKCFGI